MGRPHPAPLTGARPINRPVAAPGARGSLAAHAVAHTLARGRGADRLLRARFRAEGPDAPGPHIARIGTYPRRLLLLQVDVADSVTPNSGIHCAWQRIATGKSRFVKFRYREAMLATYPEIRDRIYALARKNALRADWRETPETAVFCCSTMRDRQWSPGRACHCGAWTLMCWRNLSTSWKMYSERGG
jgi:hypothetical protein